MSKKLKLAPYVIKRYEYGLDTFFFYNLKNESFWHTDFTTGSIIVSLDGTKDTSTIIDTISSNSPQISKSELDVFFNKVFDFLIKEGFLYENN